MTTLESDGIANTDEALLEIYRKQRPGEQPTRDLAQSLLDNSFFRAKRYDLARVGRYKVNRKLRLGGDHEGLMTLTEEDIAVTLDYVVRLHIGEPAMKAPNGEMIPLNTDDNDHVGKRRQRTVGELIQNQVRVGLSRMERVLRDRMTTQDAESFTPTSLI